MIGAKAFSASVEEGVSGHFGIFKAGMIAISISCTSITALRFSQSPAHRTCYHIVLTRPHRVFPALRVIQSP